VRQRAVVARANGGGRRLDTLTVPRDRGGLPRRRPVSRLRTPAFNYRPGSAAQYILALGN
jgi:hypothetical protein